MNEQCHGRVQHVHTHNPSSLLNQHCKRLVEVTCCFDPSPGDDDLVFSAARAIVETWVPHWTSRSAPHNYVDKFIVFHVNSVP